MENMIIDPPTPFARRQDILAFYESMRDLRHLPGVTSAIETLEELSGIPAPWR